MFIHSKSVRRLNSIKNFGIGLKVHYETEDIQGVRILRLLEPKLDSSQAADLKKELLGHVVQGHVNLVINLEKVTYVDSSGLGALLFGLRQARNNGGVLKLVRPQPDVLRLIQIARLDRTLEIFETESEAVASFQQKS